MISLLVMLLSFSFAYRSIAFVLQVRQPPTRSIQSSGASYATKEAARQILHARSVDNEAQELNDAFIPCQIELSKTCKVQIAASPNGHRFGLIATQDVKAGESVLQIPFDDRYMLTSEPARKTFSLPDGYDGWTGEAGLIALLLLKELARSAGAEDVSKQIRRDEKLQTFMSQWIKSLPSLAELSEYHPLLWKEDDQEVLQSSSTNKIYRKLDDIEEDITWLTENLFSKNRQLYPETVDLNGVRLDCFNGNGFKWAMANTVSRVFFVDGCLRLIPILDMCNHDDNGNEVQLGYMGTFNTLKGAELVTAVACKAGDEIFCSYGPKSAADYLLEHGFCPDQCTRLAVSEVTIELDPDDRFYNDKLDILECETYDQAPMDPAQTFDLVSTPGCDGDPDTAMIQFSRLCNLGGTDAFLLESIFRNEVWGFMELPVSEQNELSVINSITAICQAALDEFDKCPIGGPEICTKVRDIERKALTSTKDYLLREREALDLKEYYQQRRLKEMGLDSPWSLEEDPDLSYGQTRAPGGADYDW
jgi:[ribulose-bisphosphate carboxylase]-lysine N-methyltransferase